MTTHKQSHEKIRLKQMKQKSPHCYRQGTFLNRLHVQLVGHVCKGGGHFSATIRVYQLLDKINCKSALKLSLNSVLMRLPKDAFAN